ncbi:MAG TPA: metal-sensitive transcriptional regulator [Anaerolineae bacterium]
MKMSPEVKADVLKRLKRLEGQVRGVQRMLDEERDCREILQQLAAIRAAAQQTSLALIREHASACLLKSADAASPQEVLDSLLSVLEKA